jgi:predicted  nucleic acid-binding Zn-ribbon protein
MAGPGVARTRPNRSVFCRSFEIEPRVDPTVRKIVNDAGRKLQQASKALTNAQARILAAEDQVTELEFRAQSAEANLDEAKQALLQVEEAIRERLLSEKRSSIETQHDLASPSENG